jgi:glycerophosphoryl diester phosphodiesterase
LAGRAVSVPASPWDAWQVVAHRCGGALAPENSLAGLDRAAALGLATVEFDVMLSADGVPFLIHDETLDRTTAGHGAVAAHRAAALAALACNRGWGKRFAEERIPTLRAGLERCLRLGLVPNIEIKPAPGQDAETGRVAAAEAAAVWPADRPLPLLSSFSAPALAAARALLPDWPAAFLVESVPADWADRLAALGATSLHCHRRQRDWAWLADAAAASIAVRCYTVNDAAEAAGLRDRGVRGVFSDRIDTLAALPPR